ncbi:MAG TPA: hypothetical protein VFC53_05880, partial [Dehalococcoidia bacterium]|nr:hypothetical protein [Dehalococcoidia bacterium]
MSAELTRRTRPLLREADLHRARIEMLRELTGHEPPPAPAGPEPEASAGPAPGHPRPRILDVLGFALASR